MNRRLRGFVLKPALLFPLLLAAGLLLEGCLTASTQGLDRAVLSARAGIRRRFPDENLEQLRLKQIVLMDRNCITGRTYLVEFEDVSSIYVTTNEGGRTRSVRSVSAQVAPDGRVTSVQENATASIRRARKP